MKDRIILYGATAAYTKEGTLYRAIKMSPVEGRARIQLVEVSPLEIYGVDTSLRN